MEYGSIQRLLGVPSHPPVANLPRHAYRPTDRPSTFSNMGTYRHIGLSGRRSRKGILFIPRHLTRHDASNGFLRPPILHSSHPRTDSSSITCRHGTWSTTDDDDDDDGLGCSIPYESTFPPGLVMPVDTRILRHVLLSLVNHSTRAHKT